MPSEQGQVICKFRVSEIQTRDYGLQPDGTPNISTTITLRPVCDKDPISENGSFWKYTPAGEIKFDTVNHEAAKRFIAGHEYYVTFREAPQKTE